MSNGSLVKNISFHTLKDVNSKTCYAVNGQLLYPLVLMQPPGLSLIPLVPSSPPFTSHITFTSPPLITNNTGLTTNSLSTLLTPGDKWELFLGVTIADDPCMSVDWSLYHQNIADTNVAVCTDIKSGHALLSHVEYPFLLNSGANISISGECSDFATLTLISPHPIHGVGGTTVNAITVGTICLVLGKGHHLDITDVLYVPSGPLHLLSVLLINHNGSYASHFDSSHC